MHIIFQNSTEWGNLYARQRKIYARILTGKETYVRFFWPKNLYARIFPDNESHMSDENWMKN